MHQPGQAPGGEVAGAQSGGNFVLGEEQANPEMPSSRAGRGSSREVPGAELVPGLVGKDVVGSGEEPGLVGSDRTQTLLIWMC